MVSYSYSKGDNGRTSKYLEKKTIEHLLYHVWEIIFQSDP